MTYKYQPGTEEVNELCSKLQAELPYVNFKFMIEQGGLLRIRGVNHDLNNWRDYECLLRDQTPEQVVETFTGVFNPKSTANQS